MRAQLLRRAGVSLGPGVRIDGPLRLKLARESRVRVGHHVAFNAQWSLNTLEARGPNILRTFRAGAMIDIGPDSGLTSATISAGRHVRIGQRVLVGAGALITDSDHHPVRVQAGVPRRFAGLPQRGDDRPVVIGDDVFIGARAIILKGVTIGSGAVIGAGSVVSHDVPPGMIAAGNPCLVVGPVVR